jgi:hypothetical protein
MLLRIVFSDVLECLFKHIKSELVFFLCRVVLTKLSNEFLELLFVILKSLIVLKIFIARN